MDNASVLAIKLRQDGEKLAAFMLALHENQRAAHVYTEGGLWTVRSVVAHLTSAERAFLHLFRQIRQGGEGAEAAFSIDEFNAREQARYERRSWEELLEAFRVSRGKMIDFVATLTPADLQRVGRHPFLGITTLLDMVKMIYVHAQTHLRDVRRALESG